MTCFLRIRGLALVGVKPVVSVKGKFPDSDEPEAPVEATSKSYVLRSVVPSSQSSRRRRRSGDRTPLPTGRLASSRVKCVKSTPTARNSPGLELTILVAARRNDRMSRRERTANRPRHSAGICSRSCGQRHLRVLHVAADHEHRTDADIQCAIGVHSYDKLAARPSGNLQIDVASKPARRRLSS